MSPILAEFIGTAMLVYLGDAVCANVNLKKTGGNNSGLIVITFGWALAVLVPALIFGAASGAVFNPALTICLAITGGIAFADVPGYILAQMLGGIFGACLVYLQYKDHFDVTEDKATKRGVFCTAPAIRNIPSNMISECLGTFVLCFAILGFSQCNFAPGLNTFAVGGLILAIGVSLGGTTGYAINPARDLGPRIAHAILPIKDKGDSDWAYAWVPVAGPVIGAILAALTANALF